MPSGSSRRAYIDWARGLAVLLMIQAHVVDSWTRVADRDTIAFRDATIVGGFAAPLFLWLAGLSVPLAASRAAVRLQNPRAGAAAVCRRGLELFVLAFAFRLQAFVLSPGSTPAMIFRVDILNIMGPAIAAAGIVCAWRMSSLALVGVYGLLATAIAMATPLVRVAPGAAMLPVWLQWYVRPAGEYTTFTAFPWAGFVFAGAAAGVLIDRFATPLRERRVLVSIGAAGCGVLAIGVATAMRPSLYAVSGFWTSSPTYFAIRVGVMMIALSLLAAVDIVSSRCQTRRGDHITSSWRHPLAALGRHSLFIYWIHVELVYGYASWFWRRRLPLWATALAYALFVAIIYRALPLKGRVIEWWLGRGTRPSTQAAVA